MLLTFFQCFLWTWFRLLLRFMSRPLFTLSCVNLWVFFDCYQSGPSSQMLAYSYFPCNPARYAEWGQLRLGWNVFRIQATLTLTVTKREKINPRDPRFVNFASFYVLSRSAWGFYRIFSSLNCLTHRRGGGLLYDAGKKLNRPSVAFLANQRHKLALLRNIKKLPIRPPFWRRNTFLSVLYMLQ